MELTRIDEYRWEIKKTGAMNVPARIYSSSALIEAVKKDETFKQLINVAQLPGIVGRAMAMPDIHWGYGFPIGGVAAFDIDNGVISPGGVGYDINCGVRLAATGLDESEVRPKLERLATFMQRDIPSGVGSTGPLKLSEAELKKVLKQGSPWAISRGYGEPVEPVILDSLADASWPRFLHPFPLSEKYFLVSCKPTKTAHWGIYLVDIFDNFVLLHEEPGWAMLEPIPLRETPRQPIIPDVVDPSRTDANVLLMDVYRGPGLDGVPRGSVEALRLVSYSFTYHGLGAEPDRVGLDGPWDVKRILGTVPVADDGSAHFKVPACTPVSVQPL
ncbi:MAG: RtcB family protein, partial [Desulfobacterales bacterium]